MPSAEFTISPINFIYIFLPYQGSSSLSSDWLLFSSLRDSSETYVGSFWENYVLVKFYFKLPIELVKFLSYSEVLFSLSEKSSSSDGNYKGYLE